VVVLPPQAVTLNATAIMVAPNILLYIAVFL
jgi:hypothetical protein